MKVCVQVLENVQKGRGHLFSDTEGVVELSLAVCIQQINQILRENALVVNGGALLARLHREQAVKHILDFLKAPWRKS